MLLKKCKICHEVAQPMKLKIFHFGTNTEIVSLYKLALSAGIQETAVYFSRVFNIFILKIFSTAAVH